MIIRSMQATFGNLDGQCLTFQNGLNIVQAPNEWGKSTWSAFILAMFYGLDTKARTTKQNLADKERFLPWSGKPMEGRIDLVWNGKSISIERTSKGRVPMGAFRAFETETGVDIPEIRADNCGELLLGVEQSVFRRAGFIRLSEMTITEDESLRHRLNDLVTTGDDSGDSTVLENGLKTLKIRVSKSISQVGMEQSALENKINDYSSLRNKRSELLNSLAQAEEKKAALINHKKHLENIRAHKDEEEVSHARARVDSEQERVKILKEQYSCFTDCDDSLAVIKDVQAIDEKLVVLRGYLNADIPKFEGAPSYAGLISGEAVKQVEEDIAIYKKAARPTWILIALLAIVNAAFGYFLYAKINNLVLLLGAILVCAIGLICSGCVLYSNFRKRGALKAKYASSNIRKWEITAAKMDALWNEYNVGLRAYNRNIEEVKRQITELEDLRNVRLNGRQISYYYQALSASEQVKDAQSDLQKAQESYHALLSMAHSVNLNLEPDTLNLSFQDTQQQIQYIDSAIISLKSDIQLCEYQMSLLGSNDAMCLQVTELTDKLVALRKMEQAVSIALQAKNEALENLHRRFSPELTRQAQEYLQILTGERYDRIILNQDFILFAGNRNDTTLKTVNYRSDGTVDQINLAVRLAVAQMLTPDAPLILDDALVRFDDERLKNALELLKKVSESKQIILFTCQRREKEIIQ